MSAMPTAFAIGDSDLQRRMVSRGRLQIAMVIVIDIASRYLMRTDKYRSEDHEGDKDLQSRSKMFGLILRGDLRSRKAAQSQCGDKYGSYSHLR